MHIPRAYLSVFALVSMLACRHEPAPSETEDPPPSSALESSGHESPSVAREDDDRAEIMDDPRPDVPTAPPRLDAFATAMLAAHDAVRAHAEPTPSTPIPPLEWSAELASIAAAWAASCPDGHSSNDDYGENIYWSGGSAVPPETAVRSWADEARNYDYATTVCSRGGRANWSFCGHYTQLVWRDTRRVGCGMRTDCPGEFDTVIVCNYDPPGNVNATARTIPRPY